MAASNEQTTTSDDTHLAGNTTVNDGYCTSVDAPAAADSDETFLPAPIRPFTISLQWMLSGAHIVTQRLPSNYTLVNDVRSKLDCGNYVQYGVPMISCDENGRWYDMYEILFNDVKLGAGKFVDYGIPDGATLKVLRIDLSCTSPCSSNSSTDSSMPSAR